ncbi:uncharacterized protein LOC105434057 [Pogonomyrmex barbatus]|uniref:Uncharacterized protein LOC105434057 n=1 Tax=Pogonomyrmex barbatus TaxID=144034 RepID=A0A6I9WYN4_9HYME|nr:uncharacterized protein LOC105434057 [Pogonomyrmex barbatus]
MHGERRQPYSTRQYKEENTSRQVGVKKRMGNQEISKRKLSKIAGLRGLLRGVCGCFQDNDIEDRKFPLNKGRQLSITNELIKVSQYMIAKSHDVTQNEDEMTEPEELDELDESGNSLEIVDLAIPSTSKADCPPLQSKMWYREIHDVVQNKNTMTEFAEVDNSLEIIDLAVPSTSTADYPPLPSKMWYKETRNDIQDKSKLNELIIVDTGLEIVDLEVPSTSTNCPTTQFKMLDREIQDADKNKYDEYDEILEIVRTTIPSISLTKLRSWKPSILRQKLIFEIENIGRIMKVVQTQVNRWLVIIDEKIFPEKEFLQEYLAGADKLHELQCKQIKLKRVQEEIQKRKI